MKVKIDIDIRDDIPNEVDVKQEIVMFLIEKGWVEMPEVKDLSYIG